MVLYIFGHLDGYSRLEAAMDTDQAALAPAFVSTRSTGFSASDETGGTSPAGELLIEDIVGMYQPRPSPISPLSTPLQTPSMHEPSLCSPPLHAAAGLGEVVAPALFCTAEGASG